MYIKILKLAKLFEKIAKNRTLYHGTSVNRAKQIMQEGLNPNVGDWVASSYGSEMDLDPSSEDYYGVRNPPTFDVTFAAEKSEIGKTVGGMKAAIAAELGKQFHEVTPEDIRAYGAIIVMHEAYDPHKEDKDEWGWRRKPTEDKNGFWDEENNYPTVEPGDYFSTESQGVSRILTGEPMLRLLRQYGEWPLTTGPGSEKGKRELLIKMIKKEQPNIDEQKMIERLDSLTQEEVDNYFYSYRRKYMTH